MNCNLAQPKAQPVGRCRYHHRHGLRFHRQQNLPDLGLMEYMARMYDPFLGRFVQADTIIPEAGKAGAYDRYAYSKNNPINYKDPSGHWPLSNDPIQIIQDAVRFLQSIGYSIVGDPTVKSIYSNGTDIVAQKVNEIGIVKETLLVEVKQTAEVTLGTLGRDKVGNLGGTVDRGIRTALRLANTSKDQFSMEFKAIKEGQQAGNLQNALYTTADKISTRARDAFNYVYVATANGAVSTIKAAETFITSTLTIPFLAVPYFMLDPKKIPINNQPILQ